MDPATDLRERRTEKVTQNELARSTGLSARTLSQRFVTELGFANRYYFTRTLAEYGKTNPAVF